MAKQATQRTLRLAGEESCRTKTTATSRQANNNHGVSHVATG